MSLELSGDVPLHQQMDMKAGIDLFQIGSGITGIAARCQDDNPRWSNPRPKTFTVRRCRNGISELMPKDWNGDAESKCEFQSRIRDIQSAGRYVYPYWTCQAYYGFDGELDRVAVAKTLYVLEVIKVMDHGVQVVPEGNGLYTHFFTVPWTKVKDVFIWKNPGPQISLFH
jgi:hypothetical protein